MESEIKKFLWDIRDSCDALMRFAENKSFPEYRNDRMFRRAVERELMIIGEATRQLLRVDSSLSDKISQSNSIVAFRNKLAHEYFQISDDEVWGILQKDVPMLHREADELLKQGE